MNFLKNFKNFISESLTIKQYRPYHKGFNRERYKDLFTKYKKIYKDIVPESFYQRTNKDAYRLYLPYATTEKKSDTQLEVENVLKQNGIDLDNPELKYDYIAGTIIFPGSKNAIKIGKLLNKYKRSDLGNKFASDKTRSLANKGKNDYVICISRHPYDIAGADTDRRWWNCMTLYHYNRYKNIYMAKGANIKYLMGDVTEGTIVAFLIKTSEIKGDPVKDAYANINIKAYYNEDNPNDFVLMPDNRIYGVPDETFKNLVFAWCDEVNGKKTGYYKLSKKVYLDNFKRADSEANQQFKEEEEDDPWARYAKRYLPEEPDIVRTEKK